MDPKPTHQNPLSGAADKWHWQVEMASTPSNRKTWLFIFQLTAGSTRTPPPGGCRCTVFLFKEKNNNSHNRGRNVSSAIRRPTAVFWNLNHWIFHFVVGICWWKATALGKWRSYLVWNSNLEMERQLDLKYPWTPKTMNNEGSNPYKYWLVITYNHQTWRYPKNPDSSKWSLT